MGASRAGLLDRAECKGLLHYAFYGADASLHRALLASGRSTTMRRLLGPAVHDTLPRGAGELWTPTKTNTNRHLCVSF